MLRKGSRHSGPRPASRAASRASGESSRELERVPRERAAKVGAALPQPRMQRVRPLDMKLLEVLVVLRDVDVEPAVGHDSPPLDRVLVGMGQRDELALDRSLWELEPRRPAHCFECRLPRTLERLDVRAQLPSGRCAVEPADAHVDRVDLAAADERHQRVAGFLQREAPLDRLRGIARELDRAGVPEEVGCVKHVDVQRMALDPLAAVQEAAQHANRLGDLHAAQTLDRVDRARLIRDRADPADAGGDVGRLGEAAPAQQGFEEPRRLEDAQLDVLDVPALEPDRHRALALDAGEVVGADRPTLSHVRPPS